VCQTALTGRRNSVPVASGAVRPVLSRRDLKHRTLKPASGAHRPVRCSFANLSAYESSGHRTRPVPHKERPVTPRRAHKARAQGLRAAVLSFLRRHHPSRPCPSSVETATAIDPRRIRGALGLLPRQFCPRSSPLFYLRVVLQIPQRFKGVGEFSELCPQGARAFVSMNFELGFDSNLDGLLVAAP